MSAGNRSRSSGSSQGFSRSPSTPLDSPPLPPVSPEGKAKVDMLIVQVESLVLSDKTSAEVQLGFLKDAFRVACTDADTLKYAIEKLHQKCLKDLSMCSKVAAACNVAGTLEVEGIKLRSVLLSCVEDDYGVRKELQANAPTRFLNAVALLGEVFSRVRVNNRPIAVLSVPVLEYLETLLTGDEPEMELFAHMLVVNGPMLQEIAEDDLQNVLIKVRSTLMSRNLSSLCRLWLLFTMDLSNSNFTPFSQRLHAFYKEELGEGVEKLLQDLKSIAKDIPTDKSVPSSPSSTVSSGKSTESHQKSSTSPQPQQHSHEDEKIAAQVSRVNISKKSSSPGKNSSSSRRSECPENTNPNDKRENFRNALGVSSDVGKGKKPYWSHDDRCDKDVDSYEKSKTREKDVSRPRASDGNWRQPSGGSKTVRDEKDNLKKPSFPATQNEKDDLKKSGPKSFSHEKEEWRKTTSSLPNPNEIVLPPQEENWDED